MTDKNETLTGTGIHLDWDMISELALISEKYEDTNYDFYTGFLEGSQWQREQLSNDEMIESVAKNLHADDFNNGFTDDDWRENEETDSRYRRLAENSISTIFKINPNSEK